MYSVLGHLTYGRLNVFKLTMSSIQSSKHSFTNVFYLFAKRSQTVLCNRYGKLFISYHEFAIDRAVVGVLEPSAGVVVYCRAALALAVCDAVAGQKKLSDL